MEIGKFFDMLNPDSEVVVVTGDKVGHGLLSVKEYKERISKAVFPKFQLFSEIKKIKVCDAGYMEFIGIYLKY